MAHRAPNPDDWLLVNHPKWEKPIKDRFGLLFLFEGESKKKIFFQQVSWFLKVLPFFFQFILVHWKLEITTEKRPL